MGFRPDVRPAGRPDQRSGDVEAAVLPAPVVLTGHALLRTRPCLGLRTWKRFKPKASTFKTHLVGFYFCQKVFIVAIFTFGGSGGGVSSFGMMTLWRLFSFSLFQVDMDSFEYLSHGFTWWAASLG